MSWRSLAAVLGMAGACAAPPDRVFVPGESYRHEVQVRTSQGPAAEVRVGDWVTLHARRSTGPWAAVARTSLGGDACWLALPPPAEEPEVADNVRWTAQPEGAAEFNLDYLFDHTRRVRFSAPGRYRLQASSVARCGPQVESNDLTVVVRE